MKRKFRILREGYIKTFKVRGKKYARPLILSNVHFFEMMKYDFERLNPNYSWSDWCKDD